MAYNTPTSYNSSTGSNVQVISPSNVQKTNSNYVTKKIYRGFSSNNSNAKNGILYDMDIVKQDIYNHFMTRRGERVMMPKFGSIIWDYLYEPLDETTTSIIEEDARDIVSQDPRVTLQEVTVNSFEQGVIVNLALTLNPQSSVEHMALEFNVNGVSTSSTGGGY